MGHNWDRVIRLWDVARRREARSLKGHQDRIHAINFSTDGQSLASGGADRTAKLWNLSDGQPTKDLKAADGILLSVDVSFESGKGAAAFSTSSRDRDNRMPVRESRILLWDLDTKRELRPLHLPEARVWKIAFSPDGKILATGDEGKSVRLWDVASGKQLAQLQGHQATVRSVRFSADGKILASGDTGKTVKLWDVASGKLLMSFVTDLKIVLALAFSPDGKVLAAGDDKRNWPPFKSL